MTSYDANIRETEALIASDKVEGTAVYGADGKHIGSVERLILDKLTGQVSYAVLSFGGFLGIGHHHYPVPWSKLDYDVGLGGYRIDVTKEQVEAAPHYESGMDYDWSRDNGQRIHDYYGIRPYWM